MTPFTDLMHSWGEAVPGYQSRNLSSGVKIEHEEKWSNMFGIRPAVRYEVRADGPNFRECGGSANANGKKYWQWGTWASGDYRAHDTDPTESGWAQWSVGYSTPIEPGIYELQAYFVTHSNRTPEAVYEIYDQDVMAGSSVINQIGDRGSTTIRSLGCYRCWFGSFTVRLKTSSFGWVVADKIIFIKKN
jgi:hypothetical protein